MEHRLRNGHLVALVGAAITAGSLWLPWYEIRLGELARGALGAQAQQLPGGMGELARGLAKLLPESVTGTGWEVLRGADAALLVAAVLVAALMLAAGGALGPGVRVAGSVAGRLAGTIGLSAAALAVKHAVSPPGPDGLVSLRLGVWAAIAGGVLMALAGFSLAGQREPEPVAAAPAAGLAFATPIDDHGALQPVGASVPPPSVAPPPAR